jgi:hypothetical protein
MELVPYPPVEVYLPYHEPLTQVRVDKCLHGDRAGKQGGYGWLFFYLVHFDYLHGTSFSQVKYPLTWLKEKNKNLLWDEL